MIISHPNNVVKHLSAYSVLTYFLPFFPKSSELSDERININIISTVLKVREYELSVLTLMIACAITILVSLRAKEDITIFPSCIVVKHKAQERYKK